MVVVGVMVVGFVVVAGIVVTRNTASPRLRLRQRQPFRSRFTDNDCGENTKHEAPCEEFPGAALTVLAGEVINPKSEYRKVGIQFTQPTTIYGDQSRVLWSAAMGKHQHHNIDVLVTSRHPVAERGPGFLQLPVITGFPDTYLHREMTKKSVFWLFTTPSKFQITNKICNHFTV